MSGEPDPATPDPAEPDPAEPDPAEPDPAEPDPAAPDPAAIATPPSIPTSAGLCSRCMHARLVVSGRGSRFVLCGRSGTDDRYPRYPPLPVRSCAGFEPPAAT